MSVFWGSRAVFSLLDSLPDAVALLDESFRIVFWNKTAEKLYSIPRNEVENQSFGFFSNSDILPSIREHWDQTSQWRGDISSRTGNRENILVSWKLQPAGFEIDGFSGILGIGQDITEHKQAERILEIKRSFFTELSRANGIDDILHLCLNRAIEVSSMDCGGLYLIDPETGCADLKYSKGLSDHFVESVKYYDKGHERIGMILKETPIYYESNQLQEAVTTDFENEGLQSLAVIPIVCDGQVFGSIHVASHERLTIAPSARCALETITCQTGLLITKHRSFDNLSVTQRKYRQLFENMNEGMALHDLIYSETGEAVDYRIIDVNPAFERILGISRKQAVGEKATVLYQTNPPPFFDEYRTVATTGEPKQFEIYFPPLDKYFRIRAICPSKGSFATLFEDISEAKRAIVALKEREESYRALVDHSPDVIIRFDSGT